MAKLGICAFVLVLLVGAVVAFGSHDREASRSRDAIASVAEIYTECAAYYQVTVDTLHRDADEEVADRYRERVSANLEAGAALSGLSIPEMEQARGRLAAGLEEDLARKGEDLGDLASRYDDQCVGLLDE